ncbi:MAG: hypothetical protein UW69_C0018G0012 [Microgenomates group bacterium GW2011_GWA2_44_7]|nr:MAG: hypothetical protein UW69_C0018G0012 [Microgenomates group bacterium GW2011_GWA2_44_7]KKT77519.1 MAG: hypothetical protein UW73_C0018G0011 [Microgenomates group bacterium GW2011_GWB1_44_8]KKW02821.1 MAG: hypothetical protein UY36_C0001G0013 [Parcubacteria group bacterium GW2011_GWA1_49_11]
MAYSEQRTYERTTVATHPGQLGEGESHRVLQKKAIIFRAYQIIWLLLGVLETLLVFRFFLRLFGANPAALFVNTIYVISNRFLQPFRGIFPTVSFEGAVFEWVTVLAMIVYFLLAYGLVYFLQLVKPVGRRDLEEV